jgi:hypothetical protein
MPNLRSLGSWFNPADPRNQPEPGTTYGPQQSTVQQILDRLDPPTAQVGTAQPPDFGAAGQGIWSLIQDALGQPIKGSVNPYDPNNNAATPGSILYHLLMPSQMPPKSQEP